MAPLILPNIHNRDALRRSPLPKRAAPEYRHPITLHHRLPDNLDRRGRQVPRLLARDELRLVKGNAVERLPDEGVDRGAVVEEVIGQPVVCVLLFEGADEGRVGLG